MAVNALSKDVKKQELWLRITAFLSLRSPGTQRTYKGIIDEWCRFLGAESGSNLAAAKIIAATDLQATGYKVWLEKRPGEIPRGMRQNTVRSKSKALAKPTKNKFSTKKTGLESTQSNATIAKKFAALRRIYRALISANLGIEANPFDTDRVPPPSKEAGRKRPTEMIDFDLVKEIINYADPSTAKGLRDKAILCVLFGGGLRRGELTQLRLQDVKKTPRGTTYLYLRSTKAKKDAEQALPLWAAMAVNDLIRQRRKDGASDMDYLFVSYTGPAGNTPTNRAVSDSGIYKLFQSYCMRAGAGAFKTPHSARATAITRLLEEGIPHRKVQEFSRHSSIQMVEVYDKRRMSVEDNPAKELKY